MSEKIQIWNHDAELNAMVGEREVINPSCNRYVDYSSYEKLLAEFKRLEDENRQQKNTIRTFGVFAAHIEKNNRI